MERKVMVLVGLLLAIVLTAFLVSVSFAEGSEVAVATPTPTPSFRYHSANPHTWEVNFQSALVWDVNPNDAQAYGFYGDDGKEYKFDELYLRGNIVTYHVVATCSSGDLEAIKRNLNDRALDGSFTMFELVRRWGRWFLTGVGKDIPREYEWQVCPEWFTENGGGFGW